MTGFLTGRTVLSSVDTAQITADAVTSAKIADDQLNSEHYIAASIDNEHLADDAVGVAELSATGTASSSTFLRGDNAWAAAGGEWVRVSQTAVSSDVAQVDFTGLTTDNTVYAFYLEACGADAYNGNSDLQIQFGDSTPSYTTSGYQSATYQRYSSGADNIQQQTTGVTISDGTDADGEGVSGIIYCMHMANASLKPRVLGKVGWENQSVFRGAEVAGQLNSTLNAQSVRFNWTDAGNFGGNADGFITLYKMNLDG
jgi:hypothetical protein